MTPDISALPSISLEGLISYTQLFRFIRLWVDLYEIPWHTEYLTSLSNYMLDGDTDKSINRIACKNISFVQYVAFYGEQYDESPPSYSPSFI